MHLQWIVFATLGVLDAHVVSTTPKSDSSGNTITPFGPRMCEHLCCHIIGCSSYLYKPSGLSCRLIVTGSELSSGGKGARIFKVSKVKHRLHAVNNVNCPNPGIIYLTRRNILQCSRWPLKEHRQKKCPRPEKYSRLLVLPPGNQRVRQINLYNNKVSKCPFTLHFPARTAAAYSYKTGKLVVTSLSGSKLLLVSLDGQNRTVIKTQQSFFGLAIADSKGLVFLTSLRRQKGIYIMTTEGKNLTVLVPSNNYLYNIVADSERPLVYVVRTGHGIESYNHQGVKQGDIVKTLVNDRPLCLDSDILYYVNATVGVERQIFKTFLSNHSSHAVPVSLDYQDSRVYVFSSKIYIVRNLVTISVFDVTGEKVTTINTGFEGLTRSVLLCPTP